MINNGKANFLKSSEKNENIKLSWRVKFSDAMIGDAMKLTIAWSPSQ